MPALSLTIPVPLLYRAAGQAISGSPTTTLSGVDGLIDLTIKREEAELGAPLSQARKDEIAETIKKMSPNAEVRSTAVYQCYPL